MYLTLIISAISFVNLLMVSAVLYFLMKYMKNETQNPEDFAGRPPVIYEDLLERIKRIENNHPAQVLSGMETDIRELEIPSKNRIKTVMEKLGQGVSAESICRDYGYSMSEIGLIQAAARMGRE